MAKAKGLVARLNKEIESQKASIETIWRLLGTGENQTIFAAQFFDEPIIEFSLYLVVEIQIKLQRKKVLVQDMDQSKNTVAATIIQSFARSLACQKKLGIHARHAFDRDQQKDSPQTIASVSINITYALWDFKYRKGSEVFVSATAEMRMR